jgi:hypothetical protein
MIDWNKAPKSATHYVVGLLAYYKVVNDVLMIHTPRLGWTKSGYKDISKLSEKYAIIERPKQKVTNSSKKHIHHDLIMQWAADPSQNIWFRNPNNKWHKWQKCPITPCWDTKMEYHIGDTPQRETIRIGEFDVPKPLSIYELVEGRLYFFPLVHGREPECSDYQYIVPNVTTRNLHETREDALLHSEALRSFTA